MPRTTQCPNCGVVMSMPDAAVGRRLKCPKCGSKFYAEGGPMVSPRSAPNIDAARASSTNLTASPRSSEMALPVMAGGGDATFELPMMDEVPRPSTSRAKAAADVVGLFNEDSAPKRRIVAAEARSKARRCSSCGSVVLAGMSLCERCGLDLDTGRRHNVVDVIDDIPPPPRASGTPMGILFIGVVALIASAILGAMALLMPSVPTVGKASLGLICGFGVYASIEFLRGKSFKLMLVALLLGGAIDVVGLIAMPIVYANETDTIAVDNAASTDDNDDDDAPIPRLQSVKDRLDMGKVNAGIILLLADAAAFVYLATSRGIHRHF